MGKAKSRLFSLTVVCALVALIFVVVVSAQPGDAKDEKLVYVLPVSGTIDEGLAAYVQRTVNDATLLGADALLIELNTFGGRVDSATDIRDVLLNAPMPVLTFVTERAWSAGALIALSAEKIAMAPGASIGAAQPEPNNPKTVSAIRAEFEATAERHGRDVTIAAAMVDADVVIEGLVQKGQILTLSARRAKQLGFIDFIGENRDEVLAHFGFAPATIEEAKPNWAERVARFLSEPSVSSLLLTLGFLGLLTEITTPGWGVPGTAGVVALILFFGSRLITGLVGLEIVILFVLGFALLLLEILVIPGFGVVGILGIISMFAGLYLSFPDLPTALASIGLSLALTLVASFFLLRRLPRSGVWRKIALDAKLENPGFTGEDEKNSVIVVGAIGRAVTPLRPAGTIEVEGRRVDAVSDGAFIPSGAMTEIVRVFGTRVTVREYKD